LQVIDVSKGPVAQAWPEQRKHIYSIMNREMCHKAKKLSRVISLGYVSSFAPPCRPYLFKIGRVRAGGQMASCLDEDYSLFRFHDYKKIDFSSIFLSKYYRKVVYENLFITQFHQLYFLLQNRNG
jgi:hypothetical protein